MAVLRPVTGLAEDGSSWLARALAGGAGVLAPEEDPPAQFVHLDDLAAAVDLVRHKRLDGTYNVSPDGWIAGPRLRALAGSKPRVRPPAWVIHWVEHQRWRFQRGPIPPGLRPYTTYAWLVANDRLKAEGWQPKVTNEQAFVAGTETRWWQLLTPKRRQELALGLAGVLSAVGVAATVLVIRRAVRAGRCRVRRARGPRQPLNPAAGQSAGRPRRTASTWMVWPPRIRLRWTVCPIFRSRTRRMSAFMFCTGTPSTATTMSPSCTPAWAAAPSASTPTT